MIVCKGRNCSLFSVFLHALTNSLVMFPSSQAGRRTGEGTGTRQPGDAAARAPLLSIPGYPLPFTWGCSRHGNGRVFPGGAESQLFPLLSPISIPQRSPSCILVRPIRSPVHPSARQQQVLGVRRSWHAACKAAAGFRLSGCSGSHRKSCGGRRRLDGAVAALESGWLWGLRAAAAAVAVSPLALITQVKMAC